MQLGSIPYLLVYIVRLFVTTVLARKYVRIYPLRTWVIQDGATLPHFCSRCLSLPCHPMHLRTSLRLEKYGDLRLPPPPPRQINDPCSDRRWIRNTNAGQSAVAPSTCTFASIPPSRRRTAPPSRSPLLSPTQRREWWGGRGVEEVNGLHRSIKIAVAAYPAVA